MENLSLRETKDLLCTSMVSLAVQKFVQPLSRTEMLQFLLDEVNDKIERESDLCQKTEIVRERLITRVPFNEVQLGLQDSSSVYHSGKSSPTPEDQISSTPESISDAALHSTPSMTPVYEDEKERSHGTHTDSSDVSLGADSEVHLVSLPESSQIVSQKKQRQSMESSTSSSATAHSPRLASIFDSVLKAKPSPPMRSCSYMSAVMAPSSVAVPDMQLSSPEHQEGQIQSPTSVGSMHFPSNSLPDTSALEDQYTNIVPQKRGNLYVKNTRPQSAPSARQYQVSLGYERYSSHVDPLALTPPKPHPSGPPASVAVLKSRNIPSYTATSHSMLSQDLSVSQHCMPVQCWETGQKTRKSKSYGVLRRDSSDGPEMSGRHSRQGSTQSADTQESRKRHSSHHSYELTGGSNSSSHRISLQPRARLTSYPSCGSRSCCDSSTSSMNSLSSGQLTPVIPPSTPIVPGEPPLAFDFSGPLSLKELAAENRQELVLNLTPNLFFC